MAETPLRIHVTWDDAKVKSALATAGRRAAALNRAIAVIAAAAAGRVWDPRSWHATSRPYEPRQPRLTPAAPPSDELADGPDPTLAMYRDVVDKVARIHGSTHQCAGGHWYTSDASYRGNIARREPCPTRRAINAALIQDPRGETPS